jgi:hypothetical protein
MDKECVGFTYTGVLFILKEKQTVLFSLICGILSEKQQTTKDLKIKGGYLRQGGYMCGEKESVMRGEYMCGEKESVMRGEYMCGEKESVMRGEYNGRHCIHV